MLEAYLEQRPEDVRARLLLALTLRDLGDPAGAESAIAMILGEPRAPIHHIAGLIARDRGDPDAAVRHLRRALLCDPGHAGAWQALAKLWPLQAAGILRAAAAAAIVDPDDQDGWSNLSAAILATGGADLSPRARRLLTKALARSRTVVDPAVDPLSVLAPEWSRTDAVTASEGGAAPELEAALARMLEEAAWRLRDAPPALAELDRRLRRAAVWAPQQRAVWLGRLELGIRDAVPGDQRHMRAVHRVVAFGGLHRDLPRFDRLFEACVEAKSYGMRDQGAAAGATGHALGMQALCETVGRPVALRWATGRRMVRLGDREIGYELVSPAVIGFVWRLFLFEPGLWRWMAGFRRDDVLLDIGANVGIYTIAAAGLFGVRVAALEPYRPNLAALRRNVAANRLRDRVTILPIAATDTERTGRLFHAGGDAGAAAQHFEDAAADAGAEEPFDQVDGIPVDVLVERGTIPFPTRVKIDVDGNERAVIEGMTRTLADPRLHSVRLEVRWRQPEGRAVVERVCSFGFRAAVDDDSKNLLFTRPGLASEAR